MGSRQPNLFLQRLRSASIRANLAVLVVSCVLPVAVMAAFLISNFHEDEHAQLTANAISQARAMVAVVDKEFARTQAALQALGTSDHLTMGNLASFHSAASVALGNLRAENIVVLDLTGQLLLTTRVPFGTPLPRLASPPLLKQTLATGQPGVSDLFLNPVNDRQIFTIAVPVIRNGSIIYSLNATVAPSQLSSILAEQKLSQTWRAAIVDSTGHIVTRTHDQNKMVGRMVSQELTHHMSLADEDGFETTTLDGLDVLTVYSRSPGTKWYVVIGIPRVELTASLHRTLGWLIISTISALIAGLVLAWLIGGRLARSISMLVQPAQTIGTGEIPHIPPGHFKEANELGKTLVEVATSLQQTQARLRESEQRLTLAADATHLGFWIHDFATDELWISDAWRKLFDIPPSQHISRQDVIPRIHPEDHAAVRAILMLAVEKTGEYEAEYRVLLQDGGLRWIGARGRVEYDREGKPALLRGVSFDITARRQAELAVQQKQKEITHLSRVSMLGELSGALAHELNQPLTAILSNAQAAQRFLARDEVDLDEVREILDDIVDEDKRAREVILRLRVLMTSGEIQRLPVDINNVVREVGKLLRGDLYNQNIEFRTEFGVDLPLVSADPVQLQQVLINLIMNGCDAMSKTSAPARRLIVRTACRNDGLVQVSVIDQGAGIPDICLDRIFDALYTTKSQGMGLGLAICRNIVEANGGTLWAENNPGCGATFHFTSRCVSATADNMQREQTSDG